MKPESAWASISGFLLWGEATPGLSAMRRKRAASSTAPHPFLLPIPSLMEDLEFTRELTMNGVSATAPVSFPAVRGIPLPSPELELEEETWQLLAEGERTVDEALATVVGIHLPIADAATLLARFQPRDPDIRLAADWHVWREVCAFAVELVAAGRVVPTLKRIGADWGAPGWLPVWSVDWENALVVARVRELAALLPAAALVTMPDPWAPLPAQQPDDASTVASIVNAVADSLIRRALAGVHRPQHLARQFDYGWYSYGRSRRNVSFADEFTAGLTAPAPSTIPADKRRAWDDVYRRLTYWNEGPPEMRPAFRLDPPNHEGESWVLGLYLQALDDPTLFIPAYEVADLGPTTSRVQGRRLHDPRGVLAEAVDTAGRHFKRLRRADPGELWELSATEVLQFVRAAARPIQEAGIAVYAPEFLQGLSLRASIRTRAPQPGQVEGNAGLTFDRLVDVDWRAALGDATIDIQELERLAKLKAPLLEIGGRWVAFDAAQAERALQLARQNGGASGELTPLESLRLAIGGAATPDDPPVEVTFDDTFGALLRNLGVGQQAGAGRSLAAPDGFVGTLRGYQRESLAWMDGLRTRRLGCCLALDMGLGKTAITLALLLKAKAEATTGKPWLVVAPTSVLENWRREAARFTPGLGVLVHSGPNRSARSLEADAQAHDLVLTSYALLVRDAEHVAAVHWGAAILDEAQYVKNAATRTSQVARSLKADWRAALTGTPVENRLADLWAIFQFIAPGYLGSAERFRAAYSRPIERGEPDAAERLAAVRRLTGPFLLRRRKSEPEISAELPDRTEVKLFCTLTKEQASLYQATLRAEMSRIDEGDAMTRRGRILALLTRLKQVCNHPSLVVDDRKVIAGRSGKVDRLTTLLGDIVDAGDRALVFTQYVKMGRLLQEHLAATLGREVLFLHGSLASEQRQSLIDRFQSEAEDAPPLFVLSLKAGGTGLNLTRANHVVLADRWWNPATERQAADRAHRHGQTRHVLVHQAVCVGTLEEAIDQLIDRKVALAEAVTGDEATWLTEMSTDELRALFALRPGAVADA